MAANTSNAVAAERAIDIQGNPMGNILWRWLNVRAVNHLPCAFDCQKTIDVANGLLLLGDRIGYVEEMNWIREILSWPVEWSALHGIAEIKTPIAKVSTRTDAAAHKHVIRWTGQSYPAAGGAMGLNFPYIMPERKVVSDSSSFQRGLAENLVLIEHKIQPEWYHVDNGFKSRIAMDRAHEPIVGLASQCIRSSEGQILDLGCGNGALLSKICKARPNVAPVGIDSRPAAIAHAQALFQGRNASFIEGNLFDSVLWSKLGRYELALLMIGRLLEVPKLEAQAFLSLLRDKSKGILLYAYPGYLGKRFEELVRILGVTVREQVGGICGLLSSD